MIQGERAAAAVAATLLLLAVAVPLGSSFGGMVQAEAAPPVPAGVYISFCSSWSYKGAAVRFAQALQHRFGSDLPIELADHPPTPAKALAAQALLVAQFAALAVVFVGEQAAPVLGRLGIQLPPETWRSIQERKMVLLMGIWFVGNMVRQNLISTGAFEISYAGTPIFSKLETGRMPSLAEVVGSITEAIAASGGSAAQG